MARRAIVSAYSEYHNDESTIAGRKQPLGGHGEIILPGDTLETIADKTGLGFRVNETPSLYMAGNEIRTIPNRKTLYREDTGEALSMVSANKYKLRQPIEILETFRELLGGGGFQIEAAGTIQKGKKLWAYAKRNGDGDSIGADRIAPGIMLFESFDGTIATSARFETLRYVCNNVLSMSRCDSQSKINRRHSQEWNPAEVMAHLSSFDESFRNYMEQMRLLAAVKLSDNLREKFFAKLYAPKALIGEGSWKRAKLDYDRETTNSLNVVADLMRLANDCPGSSLPSAAGTAYGALQAVTYYQDHECRTKDGKRFESATVGQGKRRKDDAFKLALELA